MHPFLRKIFEATRLTRQVRIAEAKAAIRDALAPRSQAGPHVAGDRDDDVIDVDVVEVPAAAESDDAADTLPGAVELLDEPGEAIVEPESLPRREPAAGRFLESSFTSSAGTRAFKLFVPGGYEGDALPLVVMLHGCTQDPDDFAAGTRMNAIAQERGFMVLYPAQTQRANGQRCWNWFSPQHQHRGRGEPALIAAMTRHVLQTHSVDRERVYVAGLSAGGAMAAILAREYRDLFAAAGVHSGIVPGIARDVASALAVMRSGPEAAFPLLAAFDDVASAKRGSAPLIVFHGDADRTVAVANGDAILAGALADAPVVATTCQGMAAGGERPFRRTVWRRTDDDAAPSVAEHWVVHGSAHAWSGGDASGSFTDPTGPDASREMLRFFVEHPRATVVEEATQTSP
ncbi:MAG: PHB depolymerase family esterase [Rhizobacter sp.]|nr:PHB depolymerase family esterase [Rhizobacter sp.]